MNNIKLEPNRLALIEIEMVESYESKRNYQKDIQLEEYMERKLLTYKEKQDWWTEGEVTSKICWYCKSFRKAKTFVSDSDVDIDDICYRCFMNKRLYWND